MSERVLDLAERAMHLRFENQCLVLEDRAREFLPLSFPVGELAAVLLSAPGISVSQAALAGLAANNVPVVTCDERRQPVGMLLPLLAHSTQVERFAEQAVMGKPQRKRLWQTVVRAKLVAQARTLEHLGRRAVGLAEMARRVRSGDPDNLEAQGAQRYWRAVFDDATFRRAREGGPPNNLLNYGYAALRALVARAVCGSGLHPSLGLHHHNRYDSFALASDLMEPFRPLVDLRVADLAAREEIGADLAKEHRGHVLGMLLERYTDGAEARTLSDWTTRVAQSLARCVADRNLSLVVPDLRPGLA